MLGLIIPLTIAAIVQGFALSKIGIVPLFWVIGGALGTVGCGLFYTMDANTSTGKWIGYQILVGFVVGWSFQVALSNAQIYAPAADMSQVTAIINCESDALTFTPCKLSVIDTRSSLSHDRRMFLRVGSTKRLQ